MDPGGLLLVNLMQPGVNPGIELPDAGASSVVVATGVSLQESLLAFATASSEAACPRTLAQLEKFGCSNRVASFVLPLGYSFKLDGSMM